MMLFKHNYRKKPYKVWSGKYNNQQKKIYSSIKRNLYWLQKPVIFSIVYITLDVVAQSVFSQP